MSFCFAQAGLKAGLSTNEVEDILILAQSQPIKDKLKSVTKEALEFKVSDFTCIFAFHTEMFLW